MADEQALHIVALSFNRKVARRGSMLPSAKEPSSKIGWLRQ
jgi:hypothetical protein